MIELASSSSVNLSANQIYDFISGDFRSLWNSLASIQGDINRGNFTFALLSMLILEIISRYCNGDSTGDALKKFSDSLNKIEPRYFNKIPRMNKIQLKDRKKWIPLPYEKEEGKELIHLLFDLIRNGEMHYYHQIICEIKASDLLGVRISGADYGKELCKIKLRDEHLDVVYSYIIDDHKYNTLYLIQFRPEIMFLDIDKAIKDSKILDLKLPLNYFERKHECITGQIIMDVCGTTDKINKALTGQLH